jgi:DNA-directed RNA polymerase specialized sigma24 family protein
MNTISELCSRRSEDETLNNSLQNFESLDIHSSRYRPMLSVVAYRVLGNHEEAEDAVQSCLRVASDSTLRFEHEGAFRSWLVRVLIDEALTILNKQRNPHQYAAPKITS